MKKLTKILALLLALVVSLCAFTACSKDEPENTDGKPSAETPQPDKPAEKPNTDETDVRMVLEGFGDTLSRGNVKGLADYVDPSSGQYEKLANFEPSSLLPTENMEQLGLSEAQLDGYIKDIFAKCSFVTKTITISGNSAACVANVKTPDLENVGQDIANEESLALYLQSTGMTMESLESALIGKTDAEVEAWQQEFFAGFTAWAFPMIISSLETIEKDVNLTLEKKDGEWYITQMDDLF